MSTYKKKKIALLINAFWNSGAGISGGDQRVMQIFRLLDKNFSIDIYTSADGKKIFSEDIKSAKYVISPPQFERGNIFLCYRKRTEWLNKQLVGKKYDIIYSSSDFFPDVLPAYMIKIQNPNTKWIACVFHLYPHWLHRPGNKIVNLIGSIIQNYSLRRIRKLADRIININYQVRNELVENYHFEREKIHVNPCGINLEYFESIKTKKISNQACFIARLVPSKGIFDLPSIWKIVIKKIPSAQLKIIGGGNQRIKSRLQSQFDKLGLSKNVEILGFLENDQAYKILKESSVFIFPSYEEGFGIAILEALACNVPVVAWNLPVYNEIFDRVIKTVSIGKSEDFAEQIISLFKNPKELIHIASQSKNVVKKYTWKEIALRELRIIS